MKTQEQIHEAINNFISNHGKNPSVLMINSDEFKEMYEDAAKIYPFPPYVESRTDYKYMGVQVRRTPDIEYGKIEVY